MSEAFNEIVACIKPLCDPHLHYKTDEHLTHPLILDIANGDVVIFNPYENPPNVATLSLILFDQPEQHWKQEHSNITVCTHNPEAEAWLTTVQDLSWWNVTKNQLHQEPVSNVVGVVSTAYSFLCMSEQLNVADPFGEPNY